MTLQRFRFLFALLGSFGLSNEARSQTITTWTGTTNGNWTTGTNWSNGLPTTGFVSLFSGAGNGNTTVDLGAASQSLQELRFDTAAAIAYTFNNGTLNFDANGSVNLTNTTMANQTIGAGIQMNGAFVLRNNGTGTLTIGGNIANGTGLLTIDGTGNIAINGVIGGGSGSVVKSGSGTTTLASVTTATGSLTINDGIFQLTGNGNLSSFTGITINGSGAPVTGSGSYPLLQLRGGLLYLNQTTGDRIGSQTVTLNGGGILFRGNGNNTDTLIQKLVLNTGFNSLAAAPVGGAGSIRVDALTRNNGASVEFRSQFSTLGAAGDNGRILIKDGLFSNDASGILGGWALSASTPGAEASIPARNFAALDSSTVTIGATTYRPVIQFDYTVATQTSVTPLTSGVATDNWLGDGNGANSTISSDMTINSLAQQADVIVNNGALLTLASGGFIMRTNNFWIQTQTGAKGRITSGSASGDLNLHVSDLLADQGLRLIIEDNAATSTAVRVVKSGIGSVKFTETNTYTGGTIVNAGRIIAESASALGTGAVTVNSGGTVYIANSLLGDASYTLANNFSASGLGFNEAGVQNGAIRFDGTNNKAIGGTVTLIGDTRIGSSGTGVHAITGVISGAFNLEKTGTGSLTLSGANSFTGNLTISAGTVIAPSLNGSATTSNLGAIGAANAGRVISVATGATLSFTSNNIYGGSGLSAANLPTITVAGGTLTSTRFNVLGNLNLNGGTLTQNSSDSGAYQGFQFIGAVNVGGSAPSTISTANGKGNHLLSTGTTFTVASTGSPVDLTISAPLVDSSGDYGSAAAKFIKAGVGNVLLSAVNTNTGGTTINAGKVTIGIANALPTTGTLVLAGGTLSSGTTTGFSDNLGVLSQTASSTIALGTGSHQLTFANSTVASLNAILGTLTITGWVGSPGTSGTAGQLFFTGLGAETPAQANVDAAGFLSQVNFAGYTPSTGQFIGTAGNLELVLFPVPEPTSILLIGAGAGLFVRRLRRRTISSV